VAHRLLPIVVLLLFGAAAASPADAKLSPNNSIFFFKPGHAMSGVLANGIFTKKKTYSLNGAWTSIAASRDTLLLYNSNTRAYKTGTFRGGVFTPLASGKLNASYTTAVASCDSVLLYDQEAGGVLYGKLTGGKLHVVLTTFIDAGWNDITASCDTLLFENSDHSSRAWGTFTGGTFTQFGSECCSANTGLIDAATDDSWLDYHWASTCPGTVCGDWGLLKGGYAHDPGAGDSASDFSTFDHVAGTAGSLLFYNKPTGLAVGATLKNAVFTDVGLIAHLGTGWWFVVGGK